MDADLGFYMLPGYEMKTRFPRNNTKHHGREVASLFYDEKKRAFGLQKPKKWTNTEYGAMPPKTTWHRALGGEKYTKIPGKVEGRKFIPTDGPIKSIFDPRIFTGRLGTGPMQDLFDPDDFSAEAILDILLRDYNQRTYHGTKNQTIDPEKESLPSFDEKLAKKAEFIKMYLGSESIGKFDLRRKGDDGSTVARNIIRRPIGSIDTERTWQLVKGLRKWGSSSTYGRPTNACSPGCCGKSRGLI